jgi:hypothetical protein
MQAEEYAGKAMPAGYQDSSTGAALIAGRLQQAVRTLRGIRHRYETGRDVGSGYVRPYSMQIALGHADMLWITAAIEALEKAVGQELEPKTSQKNPKPGATPES